VKLAGVYESFSFGVDVAGSVGSFVRRTLSISLKTKQRSCIVVNARASDVNAYHSPYKAERRRGCRLPRTRPHDIAELGRPHRETARRRLWPFLCKAFHVDGAVAAAAGPMRRGGPGVAKVPAGSAYGGR